MRAGRYELDLGKLCLGFLAGAATPVVLCAIYFGSAELSMVPVIFLFGMPVAFLTLVLFVAPIFVVLCFLGRLRLMQALLLGGAAAALPIVLMQLPLIKASIFGPGETGTVESRANGVVHVRDGVLTLEGWRDLVAVPSLIFFALGVLGATAAWLIAVGWKSELRQIGT